MSRMPSLVRSAVVVASAALVLGTSSSLAARAETTRKVYVTVTDDKGQPVVDLTPADFTLKENNRDRVITSVEPAREKMRVVIAIEEALTPSGGARQGIFDLAQKIAPQAEMSIVVIGISNRVAVPYTSDVNALVAGLNGLSLAQRPQTAHVPEGIRELARTFVKEQTARPVIVLLAFDLPQSSADQPQDVLNALRDSNAQLHVVSIASGVSAGGNAADAMESSARAQVMGDGPKQSGARMYAVNQPTGIPKLTQQIANELMNQHLITYTLPDGVKPSDRLSVAIKKRGATMRAPTRISDK
jgi:VWFA-related protein